MSRMDQYILNLARQCAPILAFVILGGCATQSTDITLQPDDYPSDNKNTNSSPIKIERQPVHPDVVYNVLAGEYLGGENDLPGSAHAYAEAARLSIDPDIAERASRISYAAREWDSLDIASMRWVELSPDESDAHQMRAISHLMHDRIAAGVKELHWIAEHIPDVEEAWLTVAALIGSIPDQSVIDQTLNEMLSEPAADSDQSRLVEDIYGRSVLAYRMGRYEQAFQLANRAANSGDDIEIIRWAAQVAHAQGEREVALNHYRHGLKVDPQERDMNLAYAELLRLNGQLEDALNLLESIKADSAVLYTLAVYANSAGMDERTQAYYKRLRKLDKNGDTEHFYFCGQVAEVLERYEDAVTCYQKVQSGDDFNAARIRMAYAISQAQGAEEAIAYLHELQQVDDAELLEQAFVAEAEVLRQQGKLMESLSRLSDGLAKLQDNANLLYMRAIVAEALGDYFLAEQDLRIIIQNDPNNSVALNALGYTLANRTDRYSEALSLIERALIIDPHDPATLDSMGWVLYRLGRMEEAEDYLRRAYQGQRNAEIAAHLGEVLWHRDSKEEAISVLREASVLEAENAALQRVLESLGIQL